MGKIQSTSEYLDKRYKKPNFILSHSELVTLDKELEKYKRTFFSKYWNEDISVIDTHKWIEENGGTRNGAVIITKYIPAEYNSQGKLMNPQDCEPIRFEYLQEKLRQWTDWKAKKEYAQKMELQSHTETLAKGMTVDN